jgi:hypothetical protein
VSTAKATFVPAKPAITEVIVKQDAEPAKVVLELSLEQAEALYALTNTSGMCNGKGIYKGRHQGPIHDLWLTLHALGVQPCLDARARSEALI